MEKDISCRRLLKGFTSQQKALCIDLVVDSFVLSVAKEISIILGGSLVVLDGQRDIYRIAFKKRDGSISHIDLQGLGEDGICSDLKRREAKAYLKEEWASQNL